MSKNVKDDVVRTDYGEDDFYTLTHYNDGKPHGLHESWSYDGRLNSRCTFKEGKLDGVFEVWDDYGSLLSCEHYKAGKKHGLVETWYHTGKSRFISFYNEGERDGLALFFDSSGDIKDRLFYENGNLMEMPEEFWKRLDDALQHTSPADVVRQVYENLNKALGASSELPLRQSSIIAEAEQVLGKDWKREELEDNVQQERRGMKL